MSWQDAPYITFSPAFGFENTRTLRGTTNQISLVDGGRGGALTLALPQDIDTNASAQFGSLRLGGALAFASGGTGTSSFALNGIVYAGGSSLLSLGALTNGQLVIGSTGAAPVAAALTAGTGVTITNAAGAITVAIGQAIGTTASPTFAGLTISDAGNIVLAATTGTIIGTAITQKLGFYNTTPIAQRAGAAQAAVATTAATNTTPYGYSTAAQADAIVTLVNELRAWATAQGFIKGSA